MPTELVLDTCCFTTRWCIFLDNSLIYNKCKKQKRVSKLSTEPAEYCLMLAANLEPFGSPGYYRKLVFISLIKIPRKYLIEVESISLHSLYGDGDMKVMLVYNDVQLLMMPIEREKFG